MVKKKYSALYTDNLGCEQAEVYFYKDGIEIKVRNFIFRNDDFDFDFYANDSDGMQSLFYLKDNALIEYFIDVKIPLVLTNNGIESIKEFSLRIERQKNYYNNSLSLALNGELYKVEGYDLQELLKKMKNILPEEYDLEDSFSCIFGLYCIEAKKDFNYLENYYDEMDNSNENSYLYLFNSERKVKFDELQKIPITYIHKEFCSS